MKWLSGFSTVNSFLPSGYPILTLSVAFDAIASITWGRDMGFMKQARDVGDTIEALRRVMEHRTLVCIEISCGAILRT